MKGTEKKNIRLTNKDKSIEPSQFFFSAYGLVLDYRLQSACSRLFFKRESIVNYFEIVQASVLVLAIFFFGTWVGLVLDYKLKSAAALLLQRRTIFFLPISRSFILFPRRNAENILC